MSSAPSPDPSAVPTIAPGRTDLTTPDPRTAAPASVSGLLVQGRKVPAFAAIAVAGGILALECLRYLSIGAYLDHIEPNIVIIGWGYLHGAPLYQRQGGLPLFATFYGPLAYLAGLPSLLIFGGSVWASKLTSIVALVGAVAAMAVYFARDPQWCEPRHGIALLVIGLLMFSPVTFWVRPDPIEILLVALAVVSAAARRRAFWVGLCIGVAVNLKIHAFLYFLPILVDLWWCRGRRALIVAAAASAAAFMLPFLASGISLGDYVEGLAHQAGGRAPALYLLPSVLIFLTPLLLMIVVPLVMREQQRQTTIYAAATLATAALLLYPATIPGAGVYHLLPLVPVLADVRHRQQPAGRVTDLAPLALLVFAWLPAIHVLHELAEKRGWHLVSAEALWLAQNSVMRPVQIGYGDSPRGYVLAQLSRAVLALNSQPPSIDAQVLMELQEVGIDGSARWIPFLKQCRTRTWLLPTKEKPFALKNFPYGGGALFDDGFRHAFFENYRLSGSTKYFDIWHCRHARN